MKKKFVININVFRNVQTKNLQIIQGASFQQNVGTGQKKKGIFNKIISVIIPFIKAFIYKILLHK